MKVFGTLLGSALLVAGCTQVIDQFYSKDDFNTQSFQADISECKERGPSLAAMRVNANDSKARTDDEKLQECMISKGYVVQLETK
jgi:hypothetical protein